jgi:hypothetical protein
VKWYRLAADQGFALAQSNLERLESKIAEQKYSSPVTPPVIAEKAPQPKPTIRPAEVRDTTPPSIEIASAITVSEDSPTIHGRVSDKDKIARLTAAGTRLTPCQGFSIH